MGRNFCCIEAEVSEMRLPLGSGANCLKSLTVSLAILAMAQAAESQTYFSGIGERSCRSFLVDVAHTEIQVAALSWAQGYIAGLNVAAITDRGYYFDVSGITGLEVLKVITTFCRENLDQPLIAASDAILVSLPKVNAP